MLRARVSAFVGPAVETIRTVVAWVPRRGSLALACIDPYNLEYLSFSIIQALAALPKVDLPINLSTMDLQRNAEFESDPARAGHLIALIATDPRPASLQPRRAADRPLVWVQVEEFAHRATQDE